MCGIAGITSLQHNRVPNLRRRLSVMSELLSHRGPDGCGLWTNETDSVGFAHRRLSIIDLTEAAAQPMTARNEGLGLTYNGEIYNYRELRDELQSGWQFASTSDTETILAAYAKYGTNCLEHLRGMFAFGLWDARNYRLLCARDRFGIKPFYYTVIGDLFLFASEAKVLVPFLREIETDNEALAEYLTFQYTIRDHTLFKGISQLLPGHALSIENGSVTVRRYWDVSYDVDFHHTRQYFREHLRELLQESLALHLRSDVPVGSYVSGGIDSSLIAILAAQHDSRNSQSFHGKFTEFPGYDESYYAEVAAAAAGSTLHQTTIGSSDFRDNIENVIYHLDFPVAGPGAFPQYIVSELASKSVKVVLGGQGGDEIFGGYARYLLAYLEQCIKAAIDGTYKDGSYVVTIESIVPNLGVLREYRPMIRQFWRQGVFDSLDDRYFQLINRASDIGEEVDWSLLNMGKVYEDFCDIFNNRANVGKSAYFDSMTHFDFKCLLPALLQVEDRMSMAHGLEARVPLLDHPLIAFAATVPADVKFEGGQMKRLLKTTYADVLPKELLNRRDKMGFPVPLKEWLAGDLRDMIMDVFHSQGAKHRKYFNTSKILENFGRAPRFSRKMWALLSLELWQCLFHDRASQWRAKLDEVHAFPPTNISTTVNQ